MSATTKAFTAALTIPAEGPDGSVVAVISSFSVIDKDGDVVLPGAFPEGAAVPLCSWGHKWDELPVGRGVISQDTERAYFTGQFFLDTTPGLDTYRTVKALGELQEYSYGFVIADAFPGEQDGQPVRFIRKFARVFEASPVLVGAGEQTGTLALKAAEAPDADVAADPLDTLDALAAKALAALAEAKEGRQFSAANLDRMRAILAQFETGVADLQAMLDAAAPPPTAGLRAGPYRAHLARVRLDLAGLAATRRSA